MCLVTEQTHSFASEHASASHALIHPALNYLQLTCGLERGLLLNGHTLENNVLVEQNNPPDCCGIYQRKQFADICEFAESRAGTAS